jgi:hypothetical protein
LRPFKSPPTKKPEQRASHQRDDWRSFSVPSRCFFYQRGLFVAGGLIVGARLARDAGDAVFAIRSACSRASFAPTAQRG